MFRTARVFATAIGVLLVATACGSETRDGVELPGLDGSPGDFDVNLPPALPTTTIAPPAAGADAADGPEDDEDDGAAGEGDQVASGTVTSDAATSETETSTTVATSGEGTDAEAGAVGQTPTAEPEPPTDDIFLRVGDEGPEVASVQRRLIELDYLPAGADSGVFDQATADALIDFQAQYGLIVDGIFGPESDRALNAATASVSDSG